MIDVSNSLCIHASVNHTITYKPINLASFCLDIYIKYRLVIILMSSLIHLHCKHSQRDVFEIIVLQKRMFTNFLGHSSGLWALQC